MAELLDRSPWPAAVITKTGLLHSLRCNSETIVRNPIVEGLIPGDTSVVRQTD